MPYSNGRAAFGRRSGTVTVIEEPVRRSAARNAKISFYVVLIVVGLLAATAYASIWHPVVALFAGALTGLLAALVVSGLIISWPVLRAIWWWSAEIITAGSLVVGWIELAEHVSLPVRLGVVALTGGVPAVIRPVRHRAQSLAWCIIVRHRIRTCFSEFIITNRTGSLPLIMWAKPTPVGERIWIWLRPGLALTDIQQRLDLIAVACWAASATAEAVSDGNAARIRLDIKRRDALTGTIRSPLLGLIPMPGPGIQRDAMPVPSALDLTDVGAADVAPARPSRKDTRSPAAVPAIRPVQAAATGDEVEDWI
jgi:hypothetical protein